MLKTYRLLLIAYCYVSVLHHNSAKNRSAFDDQPLGLRRNGRVVRLIAEAAENSRSLHHSVPTLRYLHLHAAEDHVDLDHCRFALYRRASQVEFEPAEDCRDHASTEVVCRDLALAPAEHRGQVDIALNLR